MKKIIVALLTAVVAVTFARADSGGLAVMGSYWMPEQDKNADSSVGYGAKLLIGDKSFGLEVRGSYFNSVKDTSKNFDAQIVPLEVGLVLRAYQSQTIIPYIGGGGGYYFFFSNKSGGENLDDEVGWYGTGGVEIPLGKDFSIFAEALYRSTSSTAYGSDIQNVHRGVKVDLSGLDINAGLMIKF